MKLQHEIVKEILQILQDKGIMTKSQLLDLTYDTMCGNVPRYQILSAWKLIKDKGLAIPISKYQSKIFQISDAGTKFLKEYIPNISLMEAVTALYYYRDRNKDLSFTIQFTDGSGRNVIIWKSWNQVRKEWSYGIGEINCPGMASDEYGFIGNLANMDGISFGGNIPGYIVYKNLT